MDHDLRNVLRFSVANFGKAKLALDDPKWKFYLAPYTDFHLLSFIQ
jgi:hypothetical protein